MFHRILIPVEGGDEMASGLARAADFAQEQQAAIHLVHIVNDSLLVANVDGNAELSIEGLRDEGRQVLAQALSQVHRPGIPADCILLETSRHRIAALLLEATRTWQADLVIMFPHGRHGLDHFLFGSVTEELLRHSPVPMLLLPRPGGQALR